MPPEEIRANVVGGFKVANADDFPEKQLHCFRAVLTLADAGEVRLADGVRRSAQRRIGCAGCELTV
jgi:hypothetical protein